MGTLRIALLSIAVLLGWVGMSPAHAEVHLPNGEYRTSMTDLKVKVRSGFVTIDRTWQAKNINRGQFQWYFNPAWADLDLELDGTEIRSIGRTGATFEKKGDDLYILKESDRSYFITAQRDANQVVTGLTWTDRLGNSIAYDGQGRILSYTDRNGIEVGFDRDGSGKITEVHDRGNRGVAGNVDHPILTFAYNLAGQVESISDVSHTPTRMVHYEYDSSGLTKVTDVLGNVWKYHYTNGLMDSETDANDQKRTIEYQGNRVVKVTAPPDPGQTYVTTWTYDFDRGTRQYSVTETGPEGKKTRSTYDADGKLVEQEIGDERVVSRLIKESAAVDISIDERGLRTRTEYDANRNPIKVTNPDGSTTSATYDGAHSLPLTQTDELGVTTSYEYDGQGNLVKLTEAVGLPEQRVTTWTYSTALVSGVSTALGQRLTQTVKGASPDEDATTTWSYDDYGNILTMTDADSHTTSYTYDAMGNLNGRTDARNKLWIMQTNAAGWLIRKKDPIEPVGNETVMTYDNVGNLTSIVDPEQNPTIYTYTANNWRQTVTDPLGGVTTTNYRKDGQRKEEIDPRGVTTTFGYDADGRLTAITDGAQNVTTLAYGRKCDGTAASGLGGVLTAMHYPTYCEEYSYDQRGNRTQLIRILPGIEGTPQESQTSATAYDAKGQRISEVNALNQSSQAAYDALGRLTEVTDSLGGKTRYTYDAQNNMRTVADANGHVHTLTYNKTNQLTIEARPLGQALHFDYDEVGNLTTRTNPNGGRRVYGYDNANRRISESYYHANTQTASQTVLFAYDRRSLLTSYVQTGDTQSSASYVYDARGQKRDETVTYGTAVDAFTKTLHYTYESNGLKKSLTYPDGTIQSSTYDRNRLATVSVKGSTVVYQEYQWRVPTKIVMPGATRTLVYDPLQRPARIRSESVAGATIMDYRYTYDAGSNITRRETEDGEYDYSYDSLDRLVGVTPPSALQRGPANPSGLPIEQYGYDAAHNRKSSSYQPGAWIYDANNELSSYGAGESQQTFGYDANGNMVEQKSGNPDSPTTTRTIFYNDADRLSEVKNDGLTAGKYQYDPMGRRIRKETADGVIWFQYADEGLIAEYAENGSLNRAYGWKPGSLWGADPIWVADISNGAWNLASFHNDHLGVSQRITNVAGATIWKGMSEAFGSTVSTGQTTNNLRAAGQYQDSEIQLFQNRFRTYAPGLGRYAERDPISLSGGLNLYAYVRANPIKRFDETGLVDCDCDRQQRDFAPWVSVSGGVSGMALLAGLSTSFSLTHNTYTGETCVTNTTCVRLGPGIGATASAGWNLAFVGPWCGKGLEGMQCQISYDAAEGLGVSGNIGLPGKCGGLSGGGGIYKANVGAIAALTFDICYVHVFGCWGAKCECKG